MNSCVGRGVLSLGLVPLKNVVYTFCSHYAKHNTWKVLLRKHSQKDFTCFHHRTCKTFPCTLPIPAFPLVPSRFGNVFLSSKHESWNAFCMYLRLPNCCWVLEVLRRRGRRKGRHYRCLAIVQNMTRDEVSRVCRRQANPILYGN